MLDVTLFDIIFFIVALPYIDYPDGWKSSVVIHLAVIHGVSFQDRKIQGHGVNH